MIFLDEVAYPVFVPQNEGMLRPVKVIAPKGSIFNPNFPRACFARFCQVQRAVDLALRALAPIAPGEDHRRQLGRTCTSSPTRASSGSRASTGSTSRSTRAPTAGATARTALDSVDCLIANTRNNPIEELEWRFPMRTRALRAARRAVRRRQVARWHRHGARQPLPGGHDRDLRGRARRVGPALGHLRRPRRRQRLRPRSPSPTARSSTGPPSSPATRCSAGSTIEVVVPNSGGYGDPLAARPRAGALGRARRLHDVELAERDYGVVIDLQRRGVDHQATRRLRERRRAGAGSPAT